MTTKTEQDPKDAVRARLEKLRARAGGVLTPEAVVQDARRPESPLHHEFDWNTTRAAHEHWIYTARKLIQSIRVVVHNDRKVLNAPLYVRDPNADCDEQGYVSVLEIKRDSEDAKQVLLREFSQANAYLQRARDVATALSLEGKVDEIIDDLDELREEVTGVGAK